jgi:hypothetical protein
VITQDGDIAEDKPGTTAGSYSATAPVTAYAGSSTWVMQMVAFKPASGTSTAPTVTSVTPNSGPTNGGTSVTIAGANFASAATVSFGSAPANNVTFVDSTKLTASTPPGSAGTVSVSVTNPNGQKGTLTNGYTYNTSTTGIKFVQKNAGTPQTPQSSVLVTYPGAQTSGNLNVVVVGWNDTTSAISSVTDSSGNTYTRAVGPTPGTGLQQAIYYAANIAGGSNTVTVKFNEAANFVDVRVLEYSGAGTSNPVDGTAAAAGSGSLANSGTATTTTANDLIFGAGTTGGVISGPGSGFTSRVITQDGDIAEDKPGTTAGSYSATAPVTAYAGSSTWVMQMVAFKPGP